MKRLGALAVAVGLVTASCSGHGGSSPLPPAGTSSKAVNGTTRATTTLTAAPAGWANTNTQALKIANASDLGAASSTQSITVRVGLALHNVQQLQQAVASGAIIDTGTFMATYAPTSSEVSSVTGYLQTQGLSNITVEPNNLIVSATGTATQIDKAFNTSIHSFSGSGTNFIANVAPAYVPTSLSGVVIAVLGLNNLQAVKAKPQVTQCEVEGVSTPTQACLRWYDPSTFAAAYDAGSVPPAKTTPIAIMAEGDPTQAISDFHFNEQKFGMSQTPVTRIQVGLASPDTAGNGEWTLDMTYSTGMAGNVKQLYIYTTTSMTDGDITLMYNKWVTQHYTNIGNSSFGGCEIFPYLDGSMILADEALLQGAAQGQTMFVSTGDNGGYCNNFVDTNGAPGGAPFAEWPAVSPYVVAVGGTDLFTNADGTYKGENAWEAGGGGLSQFEYSPYWEAQAQPVSSNGLSFRGVPDVAMDGSIETGAIVYSNSQAVNGSCNDGCITGGTSLSSPLAAGAFARLQSTHANKLGFAAIRFYKDFSTHAAGALSAGPPPTQPDGGFHDILSGSNGLYAATPGYDYTTGLGSFDISVMNGQI